MGKEGWGREGRGSKDEGGTGEDREKGRGNDLKKKGGEARRKGRRMRRVPVSEAESETF